MGSSTSKVQSEPSRLNEKKYDYIIVGGGTAGCVIASRLTEDPNVSVLVLEAGKSNSEAFFSRIPLGFGKLLKSEFDWNYETTPQHALGDRKMYWPRGKLLGGSSSINAMMYHHCAPADFNEWEKSSDSKTVWNYETLRPYFMKSEKFNVPANLAGAAKQSTNGHANGVKKGPQKAPRGPETHEDLDLSHRGTSGPWETRFGPYNEICHDAMHAAEELGIPHTSDFNTPKGTLGSAMFPGFVDSKGERSSAATSYLSADVLARPNLTVAVGVTTTRLITSQGAGGKVEVTGVEVARSPAHGTEPPVHKETWQIAPNKEVLLCAGAVATPQLLLLSGIGPKAELEAKGVKVVKECDSVGKNLLDHLMTIVVVPAAEGKSIGYLDTPLGGLPPLVRWLMTGGGIYSAIAPQAATFLRTDDKSLPWDSADAESVPLKNDNMTWGPDAPDVELLWLAAPYIDHGMTKPANNQECFSMGGILLKPQSKGTIKLKSTNPFDHPLIDPNYLATESDRNVLIKALRMMLRLSRTEPLRSSLKLNAHKGAKLSPATDPLWCGEVDPDKVTDQELIQYMTRWSETVYHPVGSACMGTDPATSVVSPSLRVHGISNLRIVDASIFPTQISGHPTAPVIAVAERASDLIKANA